MIKSIFVFVSGLFLFFIMSSFVYAAAVDLAWDAPVDGGEPIGYIVYVSTTEGDYSNPVAVEIVEETYATVSRLDRKQSYYFIVKAYNCAGIGEASNEIYIMAGSDAFYDDGSDGYFNDVEKNLSGGCFVETAGLGLSNEIQGISVVQWIVIALAGVMLIIVGGIVEGKRL